MPIPLYRLPLLVLEEVIKSMEYRQLFILSLCSTRMRLDLIFLRDNSLMPILDWDSDDTGGIHLDGEIILEVRRMPNMDPEGWRTDKLEGVMFQEHGYKLNSYCENVQDGTRRLLEYISDLFCPSIEMISICDSQNFWILDWVEKRQGARTYEAYIEERVTLTDDEFRHVLIDLNPASLHVNTKPSENFRIENFDKKYDEFVLRYGDWLNGENLLTLNCIEMHLHGITFTATDINRFLRHVLIVGGAPRLTEFSALVKDGDVNRVLDGFLGQEQFAADNRIWQHDGTLIRRGKSKRVTVDCRGEAFRLKIMDS